MSDDLLAHITPDVVAAYLEKTRWFGGKGRPFAVTAVRRVGRLGASEPAVDVLLVELTYGDVPAGATDAVELYQVPLALYDEPEHRLDHAFVGWWEDPDRGWVHAYDALHDRTAMALWLDAFGAAAEHPVDSDGLRFHRLPGFDLDLEASSALFTGEQSNSSVAFGDDSMFKLFRKVTPGRNPDITTHEALTLAGSSHVASLYGWVEAGDPAESGSALQLGMLQQFLRTATDGWDLALSSVRTLYAEPELEPRQSGGDFAGEAERLGEALREIHEIMRERLPVDAATGPTPSDLAAAMERRLERALEIVPELSRYADGLQAAYGALAALPSIEVQQIHGDLHLGQTLRTALGWKVVDFEGEPAKTLADRLLPDSPWRDVAGMLRSFDYAPYAVDPIEPADVGSLTDPASERRALGAEWTARAQRYFLTAYAGGTLATEEQTLVDAYVADKAVYETVYESRNRPEWLPIPLAAVALIGAHA